MSKELLEKVSSIYPTCELEMISQGAEALVFTSTTFPHASDSEKKTDSTTTVENEKSVDDNKIYILKYRPSKSYRHPILDARITKSRTNSEAKIMKKLTAYGIPVPKILSVNGTTGSIWMSYIGFKMSNGKESSLKNWLWYLEENVKLNPTGENVQKILKKVGERIGELHIKGIVHGDLTSSNVVLVRAENETNNESESENLDVALIDFGLSSHTTLFEDRAVDLYLIERALMSTHCKSADSYNDWVLQGYHDAYENAGEMDQWVQTERRLKDVRMRGRKRSMIG